MVNASGMQDAAVVSLDVRTRYACPSDYEVCRRLQKKHGTTYYFATQRLEPQMRRRVHAIYGFVRVADEWVDNPGDLTLAQRRENLLRWRHELQDGVRGVRPSDGVLRAFCDVATECGIPIDEPLTFLRAMEQDLEVSRYRTYADLQGYMRGSAAAVGVMMCHVLGARITEDLLEAAMALGEAMQLTNFIRDVGEDARRGRIYLPLEDLERFGVREQDVLENRMSKQFADLIMFQIGRARTLYAEAGVGIHMLPAESRIGVQLARELYSRILNRVEARGYDVFGSRARTSKLEKVVVAAHLLSRRS